MRARVDLLRSLHLRGCQAGTRILPGTALDKRGVELTLARVIEKRVACHTAVLADASRQYRVGEQGQLARGDVSVRNAVRLRPAQRRLTVVEVRGTELADLIVDRRTRDDAVESVGVALGFLQRFPAAVRAPDEIRMARRLPHQGTEDRL